MARPALEYVKTKGLYPETLQCIRSALETTPAVGIELSEAGVVIIRLQYRDTTLRDICGMKGGTVPKVGQFVGQVSRRGT